MDRSRQNGLSFPFFGDGDGYPITEIDFVVGAIPFRFCCILLSALHPLPPEGRKRIVCATSAANGFA